jgi:ribose transport system permease protein
MTTTSSSRTLPEQGGLRQIRGLLPIIAPFLTLLALFVFFSVTTTTFNNPVNLNNILVQVSTLAILATGMTFVLLTGEIDLSIAAMVTLSGVLSAHLFANLDLREPFTTAVPLLVATFLGFISGIGSTKFRIPSFMVTLAMSLIASGLSIGISEGRIVFEYSEVLRTLGSGRITIPEAGINLRVLTVVAAVCLLLGLLILRYTRFGRYVYMTGANKSAARLAGVDTDAVVIAVMTICGFTAGLAGLATVGRLASAQPAVINSFLIDTIGAVVLGGTSLAGGRGGIIQTLAGLLIYGTLRNGLDNIPALQVGAGTFFKEFITGLVLFVALIVNVLLAGRSPRDRT